MRDMKRLPYTRQQKILEQLKRLEEHECLKIDDLARDFNVSNMTIYRDIEQLEKSGEALRVHGGVRPAGKGLPEAEEISVQSSPGILPAYRDSTIEERFRKEIEFKRAIAEVAAGYVQEGDVIAIDPSTTTLCMCSCLMDRKITVVTTSINVALQFASSKTVSVILCGGTIRKSALSVVGPLVQDAMDRVRVSKCFLSSHAFAYEQGLTDMTMEECEAKRQLMRNRDCVNTGNWVRNIGGEMLGKKVVVVGAAVYEEHRTGEVAVLLHPRPEVRTGLGHAASAEYDQEIGLGHRTNGIVLQEPCGPVLPDRASCDRDHGSAPLCQMIKNEGSAGGARPLFT